MFKNLLTFKPISVLLLAIFYFLYFSQSAIGQEKLEIVNDTKVNFTLFIQDGRHPPAWLTETWIESGKKTVFTLTNFEMYRFVARDAKKNEYAIEWTNVKQILKDDPTVQLKLSVVPVMETVKVMGRCPKCGRIHELEETVTKYVFAARFESKKKNLP